jgi:formate dehydrogenase maturation protein FdhE
MNPLKTGKYETTLNQCRQSMPEFKTVEDLVKGYIMAATENVLHSITCSRQISAGQSELRDEVMTAKEFDSYLDRVFMNVFSKNAAASEGIISFRGEIMQRHSQEDMMLSAGLPEWMSTASSASVLTRDFISLLTSLSAAHFYRHHHTEGGTAKSTQEDGKCPRCGLAPHFGAIYEDEGHRDMECWLCGEKWRINRLECPACHENRQEQLGYFSIEEMPLCRVSFCRSCHKYVKVFDIRQWAEKNPNLWILHLATLMCDDLAACEGFMPVSGVHWHDASTVESNRLNIDNK